uniref:Auxilin-like protein 1 n=1 Tax=Kalanchoe fedtschenkoi TaxID=63787 RepID=A0A7N0T8T4_KALFE
MAARSASLFRSNPDAAVPTAPLPKLTPPALSPDYREVFGRLRGGGVPVLKIPVLDNDDAEKELSFDLGLVDYDEVFGGYDDWGFTASYEELFGKSSGGEEEDQLSGAQAQHEADASLEKSCHSMKSAQNNNSSSDRGPNLSDNRTSFESEEDMVNLVNMAHVHPSSEVTRVVDEGSPLQETGFGLENQPERFDTDSIICSSSKETVEGTEERDAKFKDVVSQSGSQSGGQFLTVSGINLRTHPSKFPPPSRQPPVLDIRKEDSDCIPAKSRGGRSRSYSFQGAVSSPAFYDVEVDAGSSAAASAAAMLDAMEKSQAKLNSAKEIMERKKFGLPYRLKPSKSEENMDQKDQGKELFVRGEGQNITSTTEVASESREGKDQYNAGHKFVAKRQRQGSWSCGDSDKHVKVNGVTGATDFLDSAKRDEGKRLVDDGRGGGIRELTENVHECSREKEVQCYEASSRQRLADTRPVGVENKKETTSEKAQMQSKQVKCERESNPASNQIKTKKQLVGADSCNENDILIEAVHGANIAKMYGKEKISNRRMSTDGRTGDNKMLHSEKCQEDFASQNEKEKTINIAHEQADHQQMKTEAHSRRQNNQGVVRIIPELAEVGFELNKEACTREQNFKRAFLACDTEEIGKSFEEPYEEHVGTKRSEIFCKWQNSKQLEKPQSDDDNTMDGSHTSLFPGENHFTGKRAEIFKPTHSFCELDENLSFEISHLVSAYRKQDLNAGVVKNQEHTNITPSFNSDIFDSSDSLEKTILASAPTHEENIVARDDSPCEKIKAVIENGVRITNSGVDDQHSCAVATGQQASPKSLSQSRMPSESNDLEDIVVTELGVEVMLSKGARVSNSGAMSNDRPKLPKVIDLEAEHWRKSERTSVPNSEVQKGSVTKSCCTTKTIEDSIQKCHTSHAAVDDLMLRMSEKSQQEDFRKLEEERGREREKDSLVFDRAIHEGLQKAHSDVFPRVEKAAFDQGTIAHQQKTAVDFVKPQELKGESPQRCKARMERQRRMDERAAMALAEKNMRDLMAQREQAERNRLADSLGADVKRWAAGKEGNLRALLSTLQYVIIVTLLL